MGMSLGNLERYARQIRQDLDLVRRAVGGGSGVTDHGALTGLADDDHPQYITHTEGDAAYQPLDADLTAIAALTTTAHGRGLLDDADAAASRASIGAAPTASPTFTGTVTVPDQSFSLAKLVNIATARILGRVSGGSGVTEELTGTQATTLLDVFTSALKGLVPASGGGTSNFLRADGTWNAPGGGSSAWTTLKQTADDSKTDNTLASSTFLTVALSAATRYTIRGVAYLLVQIASADVRFDINYTGTWTTVYCRDSRNVAGVAAGTDAVTDRIASALPGSTDVLATSTGIVIVEFEITGVTNTSGTLSFRFAQVTNNASATLLKQGSYMEYHS